MAAKTVLVIFALIFQYAFSQCYGPAITETNRYAVPYGLPARNYEYSGLAYDGLAPLAGRGRGYDGLALGCGSSIVEITPTSGGSLIVSSASALPPVGVSVASDNEYGGILRAAGELPFVGTVGVEGVLPTAGAGAVNYGCGDGVTAMESVADVAPGLGFGEYGLGGYGATGLGFGEYGLGGYGATGLGFGEYGYGAASGFGYRADLTGRGCGYGI